VLQVGVEHPDPRAPHRDPGFEQPALLAAFGSGQERVPPLADPVAGQDRRPVLPAWGPGGERVLIEVGAVHEVHVEPFGQPRGLVDEVGPGAPVAVDLLEADDLGAGPLDDPGDPLEVDDVVDPRTVVDVERGHPHRSFRSLAPCTARLGRSDQHCHRHHQAHRR
jgi:hypothetical protein